MSVIARLSRVSKHYGQGEARVLALSDINLTLSSGELILVEGPSGGGKTTLLQILGLLLPADEGTVEVAGKEWHGKPETVLTLARRHHVAFIFQDFNLLESLSAHNNVAVVAALHGPKPDDAARKLLKLLDLDRRAHHLPSQMSGGQKQRVSIARALASQGELVLADEPTANLDWHVGEPIVKTLAEVAHREGRCVVIVSHDARLEPWADRVIRLVDGKIISDRANPSSKARAHATGQMDAAPNPPPQALRPNQHNEAH